MASEAIRPVERRFLENRKAYQEWLPVIEKIQAGLRDDVDVLADQEGWKRDVKSGMTVWLEDRGNVYRFLKKNGFDEDKAYSALLSSIPSRIKYQLHLPIPTIEPYSNSPLFYILPLPRFADRLGRPIAVLTPREVVRDGEGKLEDLMDWVWWASEMVRRSLDDYWGGRRWGGRGSGGEGMVVIIDAAGAGYRNIEVELFPKLGEVGSRNFPGMINAAYVVNAGWTQRGLWKVLQKVVPTSASEKITSIDSAKDMEEFFDLDRLPLAYGGRCDWTFSPNDNTILHYYHEHSLGSAAGDRKSPRRNDSATSVNDIFYSARNTPEAEPASFRSIDVHSRGRSHQWHESPSRAVDPLSSKSPLGETSSSISSLASSTSSLCHETALATIKSLTDFRLYLSPSRLAHIDLPSDTLPEVSKATVQSASRPAIYERRHRPSLRPLGDARPGARSYSHGLQKHHARELSNLDSSIIPPIITTRAASPIRQTPSAVSSSSPSSSSSQSSTSTQPTLPSTPIPPITPPQSNRQIKAISAYSRSKNPFYGYPAILITSPTDPHYNSLQPAFSRRRKRDLGKMLLFLFMLRFREVRDHLERVLTLGGIGGKIRDEEGRGKGRDPGEGLVWRDKVMEGRGLVRGDDWRRRRDWVWMIIGFLLTRGSWMGWVSTGMQVLGLDGWIQGSSLI